MLRQAIPCSKVGKGVMECYKVRFFTVGKLQFYEGVELVQLCQKTIRVFLVIVCIGRICGCYRFADFFHLVLCNYGIEPDVRVSSMINSLTGVDNNLGFHVASPAFKACTVNNQDVCIAYARSVLRRWLPRSEERRVGKEFRYQWAACQ